MYGASGVLSDVMSANKDRKGFDKYIKNELKNALKINSKWEEDIFIGVFDRVAKNQKNNIDYYTKWVGDKNFRDRIIQNRQKLATYIEKSVRKQLDKKADNLMAVVEKASKITDKKQQNSTLALLRTETNRIVNRREMLDMIDNGYKKYLYCAIIDGRTSAICRSLDGNIYNISEYEEGVTAPPMHTNCRSYVVGEE